MFKNAKIGDIVWSISNGFGKITSIDCYKEFPLLVQFVSGEEMYSFDGKCKKMCTYQSLFWNKFKIPEEAFKKPTLKLDTKVLVWDNEQDEDIKYKRHFSHFTEDGYIACFNSGKTSFSIDSEKSMNCGYNVWDNWELYREC